MTATHSPPATISKDTESFFQPTSSERTGQDFSAMHQSASQLSQKTTTSERTGQGSPASLHQPSSQLRSDHHRPESSPKHTGSDSSTVKQQSSNQLSSDRHRPRTTEHTGTDSSAPRHQSTSKLTSH